MAVMLQIVRHLHLTCANYINDDVYLSFSWADHNDEEHAGDKVWVRGSDADQVDRDI